MLTTISADALSPPLIHDLLEHRIYGIRIPGFCSQHSLQAAREGLFDHPQRGALGHAREFTRLGIAYAEVKSEAVRSAYHQNARANIQRVRSLFTPYLSPIDLVNRQGFASCTIAVTDILQRHNLSNYSYEEVYKVSTAAGDQWLERNQSAINRLATVTRILRWEQCLLDPGYRPLLDRVQFEYENNRAYRTEVDGTIGLFLERLHKRDAQADLDEAKYRCLTYLIEECPIIMPLWASQGIDFVIYPQPMTRAMADTRRLFVEPHYPDHGHWLSLKFKKRAAAADQPRPVAAHPVWATAAFAI